MPKPKIPFGWLPGHWGLKGKTRDIAKAEYELTGNELKRKLIDLTTEDETDKKKKLLELDHEEGKIVGEAYDKEKATLNGEPWVTIKNVEVDSGKPGFGSLELDWNEHFLTMLRDAGYESVSDEQLIDTWLNELCKNIALEEYSGTGDFDEKIEGPRINKQKIDEDKWTAS